MTYYLIDYENVKGEGLNGCSGLSKTDHIIIFFTRNAMKISMSEIADHGKAELEMIEVPSGKQSADMHIASYMAYLAGSSCEEPCRVVIISQDADFDNVIDFWKRRIGLDACRVHQISDARPAPSEEKKKVQPKKKVPKTEAEKPAVTAKEKTLKNAEIQKLLSKAGYDNHVVSFVASSVVKNMGETEAKQKVQKLLLSKFGEKKGSEICHMIIKHI